MCLFQSSIVLNCSNSPSAAAAAAASLNFENWSYERTNEPAKADERTSSV